MDLEYKDILYFEEKIKQWNILNLKIRKREIRSGLFLQKEAEQLLSLSIFIPG
jgi:hypothetical protein